MSTLHKKLSKQFTPEELAAAYLFQSFDTYATTVDPLTRTSFANFVNRYEEMTAFMTNLRRSQFETMMDEEDKNYAA